MEIGMGTQQRIATLPLAEYDRLKESQNLLREGSQDAYWVSCYSYGYNTEFVRLYNPSEATKSLVKEKDRYKKMYEDAIAPKIEKKPLTRWQRLKAAW